MTQATKQLGMTGEQIIADWLEKKGVTILAKNYQTKLGEVDLIVTKNETVAFVEVKTRQHKYFAISNTVTPSKQKKIIRAAKSFVLKSGITDKVLRFDVATILYQENDYTIQYIPNAFQANQQY